MSKTVKCEVLRSFRIAGKAVAPNKADKDGKRKPVYAEIPAGDVSYLAGVGKIKAPKKKDDE